CLIHVRRAPLSLLEDVIFVIVVIIARRIIVAHNIDAKPAARLLSTSHGLCALPHDLREVAGTRGEASVVKVILLSLFSPHVDKAAPVLSARVGREVLA